MSGHLENGSLSYAKLPKEPTFHLKINKLYICRHTLGQCPNLIGKVLGSLRAHNDKIVTLLDAQILSLNMSLDEILFVFAILGLNPEPLPCYIPSA